jgi:hypothetical protein
VKTKNNTKKARKRKKEKPAYALIHAIPAELLKKKEEERRNRQNEKKNAPGPVTLSGVTGPRNGLYLLICWAMGHFHRAGWFPCQAHLFSRLDRLTGILPTKFSKSGL